MIKNPGRAVAAFLFTFLLLLGGGAFAEPSQIHRTVLDNGLTVIIEEEHSAPVVSVQMWAQVGGAEETDKEAGISHVFEHMLFKGTAKRKVGQIASIIESVGGDINAYTSFDNTVYHLTVPSRYFTTGLDIISDAIQHSSFDPEELGKELEVVLEEIRMNEDNPGRNLYKSLLANAYKVHPYKRPVIGYQSTVKTFTREQILAFFKKWYVPNNMTLVIAGDVDHNEALGAIKKEFKDFKKAPNPHKKRPVEPPQGELRTDLLTKQVKDAHVGMAFHIPDLKNNDVYTLDVIEIILGGGETSRLYKKLKLEKSLVHGISAYPMSLKNPGLFFITSVLETQNIGPAISDTMVEIKRLQAEGPDHEELQRAKFNLESDFVYSRETMDGVAGKLGYYEVNLGDVNYEKKYIEGIRKVTPDDVKRVVAKYFRTDNMTVTALLPKDSDSALTKDSISATVIKAAEEAVKLTEVREDTAKVTKVKLENGITLIVKEVHSNPTVAFYAAFPGGLRFESPEKNGAGNFMGSMLTRGTVKRTREELAQTVDEMAAGVSGFSGWNSTGASGKFLSMFFDKGLGIFADVMLNPTFPQEEIDKLKKDTIAAINRQEDYLPGYTFKLFYKELYRKHPYGMPSVGTVDTVSALTREDLISHYEKFFVPERMVLTIAGDIKTEYAIEKVTALFKDFKRSGVQLPPPPVEERQNEIRRTGEVKDKEQTHTAIGFLGTTIGSEDSYALKVMSEVLSGQGGRLFLNLRDRLSLAYSVSAIEKEAADPGILAVYIASAPDKKAEAIEALMKELKEITENRVTEDELNRAKRSLIGGYEIGLQEVSSQAGDMTNNELYGLGYNFYKLFPERINAVTADDVLRVARKYIDLNAYTISIVGPNGGGTGEKK
ncbi:MAG: insulinase family protein [Deltaproteobacteria bacterium]|nr:insulinase family protein [Deltaproteobacteria bacterium]